MSKHQTYNAISSLLDEKMNHFKLSFNESSRQLFADSEGKLVHPGEFGEYRESITKDFLSALIPQRMGIDSGFVVTSSGDISTQCDLVIYDKSVTPLLKTENLQRFFPIESVCAVGEVKSVLSLADLKKALRKLAKVKSMRDSLFEPTYIYCSKKSGDFGEFQPELDEKDQIISFLICESFDFDLKENFSKILACYKEELPQRPFCHRHNLILSIEDGLLAYLHPEGYLFQFPSKITDIYDYQADGPPKFIKTSPNRLKNRLVLPNTNSLEHIRHFSTLFHQGISLVSVLFPDMSEYIQAKEDVTFVDLEQE